MGDYVTRDDLDAAIEAVTEDIRDTEERLRGEFTSAVRFEIRRIDEHLDRQDGSLRWMNRTALTSAVLIICALIYLVR